MNAMSTVDDPGAAAGMAAEAVRTLNDLTLALVGMESWLGSLR
jgi:hypothetical protein